MKRMGKLLAVCLVLALVLTGCQLDYVGYFGMLGQAFGLVEDWQVPRDVVAFRDMTYTRPELDELEDALDAVKSLAQGSDSDALMDGVLRFLTAYDDYYTAFSLAYIHYSADLTDETWQAEHDYCTENSAQADAWRVEMLDALADSPLRGDLEDAGYFDPGFLDAYGSESESMWDETFVSLLNQEASLVNEYYSLYNQLTGSATDTQAARMEALFVELVAQRQKIAAYAGYDSYPAFAYDFSFYREYTPEDALAYTEALSRELAPLYRQVVSDAGTWEEGYRFCSERKAFTYVRDSAQAMGGVIAEAFALLDEAELYDLEYSGNKMGTSFEVFLNSYEEPFIFVNPDRQNYDKLTFAHEFGHFANDFACVGSYAGTDVAEVYSQGMEYLSLCYSEDSQALERCKLADCLCTYVEQAAYASFEHQVYGLTGAELTVENVEALYSRVAAQFGLDALGAGPGDYVFMPHLFTDPMYIISYVVSNDAAFQIYQMERAEPGTGLALYESSLTSQQAYFEAFLEETGLTDPMAAGRPAAVRETLEAILR